MHASLPLAFGILAILAFVAWRMNYCDSHPVGKSDVNVIIVTYMDRAEKYYEYTKILNQRYCDAHGYRFFHFEKSEFDDMPPWWRKVFLVREVMRKNPDVDIVMWMDSDAAFTHNTHWRLEDILDPKSSVHVSQDVDHERHNKNPRHPNAGTWAVRNDERGRKFLDAWYQAYEPTQWCKDCTKMFQYGDWKTDSSWGLGNFEQGVLLDMVMKDRSIEILPCELFGNMFPFRPYPNRFITHMMGCSSERRESVFGRYL